MEVNNVYKGDCLELMQDIETASIDMILCDLPYGTTQCKWDTVIPFDKLWEQYNRIIKTNGAIVLFGTEPFSSHLRISNLKDYKYDWVWDKKKVTGFLNCKKQPLRNAENVSVFYRKQPTYTPQPYKKKTAGSLGVRKPKQAEVYGQYDTPDYNTDDNLIGYPRTIITDIPVLNNISKDKAGLHPTQKPVALLEYLIKTYSDKDELILDNCAGSGSTGVACQNLKRNYILMEKEEKYYNIIIERLAENQKKLNEQLF